MASGDWDVVDVAPLLLLLDVVLMVMEELLCHDASEFDCVADFSRVGDDDTLRVLVCEVDSMDLVNSMDVDTADIVG